MSRRQLAPLILLALLGIISPIKTGARTQATGDTTGRLPFEHKITWSHANLSDDRVSSRFYEVLIAESDFNDENLIRVLKHFAGLHVGREVLTVFVITNVDQIPAQRGVSTASAPGWYQHPRASLSREPKRYWLRIVDTPGEPARNLVFDLRWRPEAR